MSKRKLIVACVFFVLGFAIGACATAHVNASCTPDDVHFYPSPVVAWGYSDLTQIDGFRVYARTAGQPFTRVAELPCWWYDPEDGTLIYQCNRYAALQRYSNVQLEVVEWGFSAYRGSKESTTNNVTICMPSFLTFP